MQLWVSKLNKNKWKIALIILSVALVSSCIFGVTTAWLNNVDQAHANVKMETKFVDVFIDTLGNNTDYEMIPGQQITGISSPKVLVNETEGTYCVFVQVSELGGTAEHTYLEYSTVAGWNQLTSQQISEFNFPVKEDTSYYYQLVDASQISWLDVLNSTVTVTANTTYKQIKAAWEENSPVKLQCVAAGCKTKQYSLATKEEVDFAEVYTAFIG